MCLSKIVEMPVGNHMLLQNSSEDYIRRCVEYTTVMMMLVARCRGGSNQVKNVRKSIVCHPRYELPLALRSPRYVHVYCFYIFICRGAIH